MERHNGSSVAAAPVFDRLQYFYGQLLGARDFQVEQAYFREKLKLHNRCVHGYGVVCGLEVTILTTPEECPPPQEAQPSGSHESVESDGDEKPASLRRLPEALVIQPGLALDCHGNELVVREPLCFEPRKLLQPAELRRLEGANGEVLYVSLCFHEQPVEPTRPAITDTCGAVGACAFGKLRDAVRVHVTLDKPDADDRCETCCAGCTECCLLLARVDEEVADNAVRRELATHVPARIAGVSWVHGAAYGVEQAKSVLGTYDGADGLEIRFTRPVHADCLRDPILQIHVTDRGRGRAGEVHEVVGEFVGVPGSGLVSSLRYRQTSGESLQQDDLVTITLRAPMVLDGCCRPVEGLNVGGRVPLLPGYEPPRTRKRRRACAEPPFKAGPWTTHGHGNFESWFFISADKEQQ